MILEELGAALSAKEVSTYLKVSVDTVRTNYKTLGGKRVGSRYIFFEKLLINAILRREQKEMGWAGSTPWEKVSEDFCQKDGCKNLGNKEKKRIRKKRIVEDRHNLVT